MYVVRLVVVRGAPMAPACAHRRYPSRHRRNIGSILRNKMAKAASAAAATQGSDLGAYYVRLPESDGAADSEPAAAERVAALLADAAEGHPRFLAVVHSLLPTESAVLATLASENTSEAAVSRRFGFVVLVACTALLRARGTRGTQIAKVAGGGPAANSVKLGRGSGSPLPTIVKGTPSPIDAAVRTVALAAPRVAAAFGISAEDSESGSDAPSDAEMLAARVAALPTITQGRFVEAMAEVRRRMGSRGRRGWCRWGRLTQARLQ